MRRFIRSTTLGLLAMACLATLTPSARAADAAPAVATGTRAAGDCIIAVGAKIQPVKYPWSSALYFKCGSAGSAAPYEHMSTRLWLDTGRVTPLTVTFIPGSQVLRCAKTGAIWMKSPPSYVTLHHLTLAEWRASGQPYINSTAACAW